MLISVNHTAISVADMERSLAFYRDLLGMKVAMDVEGTSEKLGVIVGLPGARARIVMLELDNQRIELFQYRTPVGKPMPEGMAQCDNGLTHIAFNVTDLDGIYEGLKEKGVRFYSEPQVLRGEMKVVYFKDPDGVTLEFMEDLKRQADPPTSV
jgi:catechol 2,3-dioxygenase-like lactoylglutathione lyase family enzyme